MSDAGTGFLRFHLPALAWAVVVACLLLMSPPSATGVTDGPLEWMFALSSYWADLGMHTVLSGVMSGLLVRSFRRLRVERAVGVAVLLTILYSTSLELAQQSVPGRAIELQDVLANTLGAGLGGWLSGFSSSRRRRRNE